MVSKDRANTITLLQTIFYSLSILVFLLISIGGLEQLKLALSICAVLSILISLPRTGVIGNILTLLFLGMGTVILWNENVNLLTYVSTFGGMFNLLALFSILPLIAIPIRIGGYSDAIKLVLESKITGPSQLYRTISFYSFFLSCFMNLATLPMMYYSIKNTVELFPIQNKSRFISMGITHGFALPILWTPIAPIVGVVFDLTQAKWLSLFPVLLLLSVAGWGMDLALYHWKRRNYEEEGHPLNHEEASRTSAELAAALQESDLSHGKPKLKQMSAAVLLFIALIIAFEHWVPVGFISTVILLTIPFSLLWSVLLSQAKAYAIESIRHFGTQLPKMSDQFSIFLSAGFFVAALQSSGSNAVIHEMVTGLDHLIGAHIFLVILPLIPLLLAFLGMHPALAISLMAESLDPATLGVTSEQLALALLGGAVSTFLMGPFNATSGIMASITKVSPFRIVSWNAAYTVLFLGLLAIALLII